VNTASQAALIFLIAASGGESQTPPDGPVSGSQLIHEGRLQEALQGYLQAVESSSKSVAANTGAGVALDLLGRYAEAQTFLSRAILAARAPADKAQAERVMAISHGFAADCRGAEKYDRAAYEFYRSQSDFYDAGEVADELGRLCLDIGDFDSAYDWYRRGHDSGLQEENASAARRDLWNFRWDHARARIAARRGNLPDAAKYVAAAKAILDKGTNPEQQAYLPYLIGYVAFYGGDYAGALAQLKEADQSDPFIQCLTAQCHEKLGDETNALVYYRRAAGSTAHSVPAAYARPFALRKLR
jgi:tetratricopeptide (TPR) repeat protein